MLRVDKGGERRKHWRRGRKKARALPVPVEVEMVTSFPDMMEL